MERADIAGLTNALREAFLAAGKGLEEKRQVTGSAFFVHGHAIGQFELRAGALRARLWLADRDRRTLEARPTFDADSGWLHVVSDEDVAFVRGLIPAASRAASSGNVAVAPSSPRPPATAPAHWTVDAGPAEKRKVGAVDETAKPGEKKKSASRRPPSRI
jgi:hypothetical protein